MKYLFVLLIGLSLLACNTKKKANQKDQYQITMKPKKNTLLSAEIGNRKESSPFKIKQVEIKGNKLFVSVSYVGGCGSHTFEAIGNRAVMKSLPPKRSFMIVHTTSNEVCESMISEVLEIDLKDLAVSQTAGSTVVLILDGWEEEINYVFE